MVGVLIGEAGQVAGVEEAVELAVVEVVVVEAVALAAVKSLAPEKKMQQLTEEAGHYVWILLLYSEPVLVPVTELLLQNPMEYL